MSSLITMGLGLGSASGGLILRGLDQDDVPVNPVVADERPIRLRLVGQSSTKRKQRYVEETLTITATMIELNGVPPRLPIRGFMNVQPAFEEANLRIIVEHVGRETQNDVNVRAQFVGTRIVSYHGQGYHRN